MGHALSCAPTVGPVHDERRRPEQTTLYRLVQAHAESFFAQVEAATGAGLPEFVKEEFDAFLECGILAHGFLRLRCAQCAHEKLVALSCKRRGFCPSCGARRMAGTAAHLVEHVVPRVPVRQWVLSFPIPLRTLFAAQPQRLAPVLQVIHRVIATFLLKQTGLKRSDADTGAVTLIQRFGAAANLNIHLHCLVLDGVYRTSAGGPVFHAVPAPTVEQVQALLVKIIRRSMKLLTRLGALIEEEGLTYLAQIDAHSALTPLQAASCTYRIALGSRAGQKVLSLQTVAPDLSNPRPHGAPTRTASACTRGCAVTPMRARTSNDCAAIVPIPEQTTAEPANEGAHAHARGAAARMSWARLLKRVFDLDIERCPQCGSRLKIIAAIEEPAVIARILTHLGLSPRPPPRAPARRSDLFQAA